MFSQATSSTLPEVTLQMSLDFLESSSLFSSAKIRGSKAARSARPDYSEKAVGFVELKRDQNICTVRGKITPEHQIRTTPYTVSSEINEAEGEILSAQCHDCVASQGGCKHAVAFLFWLKQRTDEPSPTSTVSYWKKISLASVGSRKVFTLDDFCGEKKLSLPPPVSDLVINLSEFFVSKGVEDNMFMLNRKYFKETVGGVSLHQLVRELKKNGNGDFLEFCSKAINEEICVSVEENTRSQRATPLWYELKYGRITTSIFYESAHCRTSGGSLVEKILGSCRPIDTQAMKRGRDLEEDVLQVVEKSLNIPLRKVGLSLRPDYPFLGASADAVGPDFCVEVKCPSKKKTVINYILPSGDIAPGYHAQIQLQMLMRLKKGLFVVANLDMSLLGSLITASKKLWLSEIYPYI